MPRGAQRRARIAIVEPAGESSPSIAALEARIASLTAELAEARAQQTATTEVLQVINSSPGDLAPVFDALLDRALRLCRAPFGSLHRYDGAAMHLAAFRGDMLDEAAMEWFRLWVPEPDSAVGQILKGAPFLHIEDVRDTDAYRSGMPSRVKMIDATGARTAMWVALRHDDRLLGIIVIYRQEVRPFADAEIALVRSFAEQAVIAMENARLLTETREALEQQTATAEVLGVINSSPGELTPVFDALLDKAMRLCEARFGALALFEGRHYRSVAHRGVPPALADLVSRPVEVLQTTITGRLLFGGEEIAHIADIAELGAEYRNASLLAMIENGARTSLWISLRKEGVALGFLIFYREEVRLFSDKQVALLQNFAAQAVIAMENARLIIETREALERQTATSEVLQAINSSPGDLAPVFDAVVERAVRLCEADEAALRTFDGELLHLIAVHGSDPEVIERLRQLGPSPTIGGYAPLGRGEGIVHIVDVRQADIFRDDPVVRQRLELRGIRTWLAVALRKDQRLLGVINVHRHEVRPFTDKQIALLQNFAAQAVIAMENARLITETREALEQQTATAEVLQVINSSPGDLAPVFDAMLEKAVRLCEADTGHLFRFENGAFFRLASRGVSEDFDELFPPDRPVALNPNSIPARMIATRSIVHVRDQREDESYRLRLDRDVVAAVEAGILTVLFVPLIKEGEVVGHFTMHRIEVKSFSEKQIALLQNFAAQAVIAIENARLLTETRDALDQQTATAEVLQVINSSPGDLAPVFQAIVESAHALCSAAYGSLQLWDGEKFRAVAIRGFPDSMAAALQRGYSPIGMPCQRLVEGERIVHVADLAEVDSPTARVGVELGGVRTVLYVALRKDDALLGQIVAVRQEVRPFSDKEIALLENFAAQAVIAMENARLINETREAFEQQQAIAEVLQVINSSPGDLAPVFDAILEKAHSLCGADFGSLVSFDGEFLRSAAERNLPQAWADFVRGPIPLGGPDHPANRLIRGEPFLHIEDLAELARTATDPMPRAGVELAGIRTLLLVPLRKDGAFLGYITAFRQEVRPFSDKEIALLENFAAQAVIAMENARLINETREALEQQQAIAEVLQVINRSTFDVGAVLEFVCNTAARICNVQSASIFLFQEGAYRWATGFGVDPRYIEIEERAVIAPGVGTLVGRVAQTRTMVHILDGMSDPAYEAKEELALSGLHTILGVPLLRDDSVIGVICLARQAIEAFTGKQIELVRTFGDQAVIAIENARLINETREALEQQTATAEVLGVINSSPGDLAPVFDAMLEKAMRLCDAETAHLMRFDATHFSRAASRGVPPGFDQIMPIGQPVPHIVTKDSVPYRMAAARKTIAVLDLREDESVRAGAPAETRAAEEGIRTVIFVPLLREDEVLGCFVMHRMEVRAFTDKQIALVENFAVQAVIAMENARLITETREALEQQTATAEVLGVINSSPGNLVPVFEAMLDKALALCDAAYGGLWTYDGTRLRFGAGRGGEIGLSEELLRNGYIITPDATDTAGRLLRGEPLVHIADVSQGIDPESANEMRRALLRAGGRSLLAVPLWKDSTFLGYFGIFRREVRPFTDKQIALLQNFAAQALIAMENARLITETREALEQQTATAEVLQVINSSPGDLAPVFETILQKAHLLAGATLGALFLCDGEKMRAMATFGYPEEVAAVLRTGIRPPPPLLEGARLVHSHDIRERADEEIREGADEVVRLISQRGGVRTNLIVPLRKDGVLQGMITCNRQEVRPYTDKQIALLENFAAQAVIAIENAHLLTELRESLEQQQAIAEVLGVINANPGDLQPVFNAILEKAMALCDVSYGDLELYEGEIFRAVATRGLTDAFAEQVRRGYPARDNPATRPLIAGERVSHIINMAEVDFSKVFTREPVADEGHHTLLCVPLRRENALLGMIACARGEVRAFSENEIALLESFAAQAVIAIENARLLDETREALEQQTATAEVLGVINSSPGDLAPVFEVMAERAVNLCEADEAAVRTFDGDLLHLVTTHGTDPLALERLRGLGPTTLAGLYEPFARGDEVVHYFDARDTDAYRNHQTGRQRIDARGIRSWLAVALRKEDTLLGIINVHRREVRPFHDKQIALLQNFAQQAVIAMDNARLLDEIRQRQAELRVTFDNMADGVAMFDAELRLAAWNMNFQELLNLPDDFLAAPRNFEDYIRFLAGRGEFGDIDIEADIGRYLERSLRADSFERERPDGRIIEVRHNPVPGGGFVLIYGDITERMRAEEQVRAARDAAEAALAELKATQQQLVVQQKMAALGQLTAGIAHEIKNPLNFVNNFATLSGELLDELKEDAAPALATLPAAKRADIDETFELLTGNLAKIAEHGQRADNIVKSMLAHSRGSSGERQAVDLNGLVDEALNLAYHGARAQDQSFNITLERDFAAGLPPIELVPQDVSRVFLNLIGNGFYAAHKRRQRAGDAGFKPLLKVTTRDLGETVEVAIRDNGIGIAADDRDKLFQPFFTTKPTGEGTGLGLSISYDIVTQQHGGTIEVASEVDQFTQFTICLPRRGQGSGRAV